MSVGVLQSSTVQISVTVTVNAAIYQNKTHKCVSSCFQFSDGAFTGVTAIKSLHLDNNKLKSLPKGLELGTITNLTLSNNPWSCTCQLAPLRR